jgi:hypothetical protein
MVTLPAGEAAEFGGTPPAAARRGLRLVSFRPLRKGGLLGFATVEFLALGLVIADCPVQKTHARIWCGLPAKPVLDQSGPPGRGQRQEAICRDAQMARSRAQRPLFRPRRARPPAISGRPRGRRAVTAGAGEVDRRRIVSRSRSRTRPLRLARSARS